MSIAKCSPKAVSQSWGSLPARIKLLYITTLQRTGGWLSEALATDGATQLLVEEAIGVTAGLARLRDEVFDAVLVSHEPGALDALELVEGLRGGGHDEPMIVLGTQPNSQMDALCYEVGADAYRSINDTTTRSLLWEFARAIERCQLLRENRRLMQAERQRLAHEHQEAERLLDEQRALIADLELLYDEREHHPAVAAAEDVPTGGEVSTAATLLDARQANRPTDCSLPDALVNHYREMLRAQVIMGAGNLGDEMSTLADLLADAGVSAQQTMQLHVHVLEEIIRGLGNRSARHVMNRADLLALEVMAHLADGYRERYDRRVHPPQQLVLPGFDFDCLNSATRSAA